VVYDSRLGYWHSITNLGILFFSDPSKGAQEIYRTLKPGGTAIVTSWAHLGYLELINEAQRAVNPNNELYRVPIPREWYQGAPEGLLEKTLRDGGFHDVKVHEKRVYYAAKSVGDVCDLLMERMEQSSEGWKGQENEDLRQQLKSNIEKAAVPIERLASGGLDGAVEALVGIPMTALVAVARR
jgi:SAM-dependent methyltransferase